MVQEARPGVWQNAGVLSAPSTASSDSERRRRRLEMYRQRHKTNLRNFDVWMNAVADGQRQQTAMLFQRWLDSRCKRTMVSKSKLTKGDALVTAKAKRNPGDGVSRSHDEQGATSSDIGSCHGFTSKQREVTENACSKSPTHTELVDPASVEIIGHTLLSVSEAAAASNCKQEVTTSDIVNSDMFIGGCVDDSSDFLDILKTMNGNGDFSPVFQHFLAESEGYDSGLSYGAGDLSCLSAADVNDAVSGKLAAVPQVTGDGMTAVQPSQFSATSLQKRMNYSEVPNNTQTVPVNNYWQLYESLPPYSQPVPTTALPSSSYWHDSLHRLVEVKEIADPQGQFQLNDSLGLPKTHFPLEQHQHKGQQVCWYTAPVQKPKLYDEDDWVNIQAQPQQDWEMSQYVPQQLLDSQLRASSDDMHGHSAKKETTLTLMVPRTSNIPLQMLPSVPHRDEHILQAQACNGVFTHVLPPPGHGHMSVHASFQPGGLNCSHTQQAHPSSLMHHTNFTQECGSAINFVPHGGAVSVFGETCRPRIVTLDDNGHQLADVSNYIPHMMVEQVSIPTNPQSTRN